MSVTQSLKRIRYFFKKRYSVNELLKANSGIPSLRLHLGCGQVHLKDWINIDVTHNSLADVVMDFKELKNNFQPGSVTEVLMVHSISYLRLWEARDFLAEVFSLLKPGGRITLEFPDVIKCAAALTSNGITMEQYLEAIRPFYAFDLDEISQKVPYTPYAFGWSAWHLSEELRGIGFSVVTIKNPETHGQRTWRDSRIEALK